LPRNLPIGVHFFRVTGSCFTAAEMMERESMVVLPHRSAVVNLPPAVRLVLTRLAVGDHVSSTALGEALMATADLPPPTRDVTLGSLMTAVMMRGPLAEDVVSALTGALGVDHREPAETIGGGDRPVVLVAGSGKKGLRTVNVSTPAALVAAAAGARVIKIGSAATSSAVGSRDLVRALGLRERSTADEVRADLAASGFAFVAIEPEIPLLDSMYGGRFHAPNPFSFGLAPLVSPVRGDVTVFGLSHPRVDVAARVLSHFGLERVDVLSTRLPSGHYLDEIGCAGELRRCRVRSGEVGPVEIEPAGGSLNDRASAQLPIPDGPEEAVEWTADLLAGRGLDGHRTVVALNAAHLLVLGGIVRSRAEGLATAEEILRSGVALTNSTGPRTAERSA
jgi:anthranilate phosphoribosyltransferase